MTHPTTSPSGPDAPCGTVLVVEDELQLRRVVERLLAVAGYHVHLASGGLSALATLAEHGDSLCAVYLDLTLPDMRGEAVLERVRAQFPALPVLLTSGGGPPAAAVLAFDATVFLPKPFSPRELRDALARVVASAGVAGQGASPRARALPAQRRSDAPPAL
jgi:two-component system NtrC family response regulator